MQPSTLAKFWDSPHPAEFRRVYHVSPTVLNAAIDHAGIDPAFANGSMKVSWWCDKEALLWAVAHTSSLKSISVDQLTVHSASIWRGCLVKAASKGVYNCRFVVMPAHSYPASQIFSWFHPDGTFLSG